MTRAMEHQVRERARACCEYCQISADAYDQPFHIDHIIARKHGGKTEMANLAFCCLDCNLYKGTDIAGIDPVTAILTRLFHPRIDQWTEHFKWDEALLVGLTPVGRVTEGVLRINQPIRVQARSVLIVEGVFPPHL